MVKLVFMGWGRESKHLYEAIRAMPEVQLAGISTSDDTLARHLRAKGMSKVVESDYRRLLGFHDVDGVIVAAGKDRQVSHVVDAFTAGKHVLMGNPIATNVSDALTIQAKADQYPTQYGMVALPRRLDSNLLQVKRILQRRPSPIRSLRLHVAIPYDEVTSARNHGLMSGIYMDELVDDMDIIPFLTGDELSKVYAEGRLSKYEELRLNSDVDTTSIIGTTHSGIQVNVYAAYSEIPAARFSVELLTMDYRISTCDQRWATTVELHDNDTTTIYRQHPTSIYGGIVGEFAQCIATKRPPAATLASSVQDIKAAVALSKSDVLKELVSI